MNNPANGKSETEFHMFGEKPVTSKPKLEP